MSTWSERGQAVRWALLPVLACLAAPAAAQSASGPKWDVDVHIGQLGPQGTVAGTGALPAPGATFTIQGQTLTSRQVPSWYFGDGARLFNQSSAFVGASGITPLDGALTSFGATRKKAQTLGVRFTRRIGSRFGIEIGFDQSKTPLAVSDAGNAALEASRASFVTGWNSLIAAEQARIGSPNALTNVSVTSLLDQEHDAGSQIDVTVAFKVKLLRGARLAPYVLVGGGVMISPGSSASASLTGHYEFQTFGNPKSETDHFSLKFEEQPISSVIVFGGGAEGAISKRTGWRVDVRALSRKNTASTTIQTFAERAIAFPNQQNVFSFFTDPAIQFSNNPTISSSLTGFTNDFETFHGTGRTMQTSVTVAFVLKL